MRTLLGPEGPDPWSSDWEDEPLDLFLVSSDSGGGYRPYFENYTVDASILDSGRKSWITKINKSPSGFCRSLVNFSNERSIQTHVISSF